MEPFLAAIVGVVTAVVTLGGTVYASRRWGLPGLAREVDSEQRELIGVLRENNRRLRRENVLLKEGNEELVRQKAVLVAANRDLRGKLAVAYDDIAQLYRALGRRVPEHVHDSKRELSSDPVPEIGETGG